MIMSILQSEGARRKSRLTPQEWTLLCAFLSYPKLTVKQQVQFVWARGSILKLNNQSRILSVLRAHINKFIAPAKIQKQGYAAYYITKETQREIIIKIQEAERAFIRRMDEAASSVETQ